MTRAAFRAMSLEAMRTIYARTVELRDAIHAEAVQQRQYVFRSRLVCLAMLANFGFAFHLSQGALSQSNDFFLFLNCIALAGSGVVLWRHVTHSEIPWRKFRRMQAQVVTGARHMRAALDEVERAERETA